MLALWTSQYSTVQLQYTWKVSKAKWINDVPGCNKTFWIVEQFNVDTATVVTCTMEVRIGHLVFGDINDYNKVWTKCLLYTNILGILNKVNVVRRFKIY